MSTQTTTIAETAKTVTLTNGSVFTFTSNKSVELDLIPVIDASRIWSDKVEDRQAVAEEVREASRNVGFFYLINHASSKPLLELSRHTTILTASQGIDTKYADATLSQAKRFFALPEDKKMEVFTGLVPNEYVGFHPMKCYNRNGWKQQDLSEAFNWGYDPAEDPDAAPDSVAPPSLWPEDLPGFRETLHAHHTQLLRLARRLTRIFALALHLPEAFFDEYVRRPEAGMRILHYPPQTSSVDDQNGIGAHTDVECFTMVTQDGAGGLEVLGKDGRWVQAKPIAGSLVVNIADCFMRQTNDFFVSTVHRVVNTASGHARYSTPFFFGFDRAKLLEPVPTCVSDAHPMKYPVMTGGEYYAWRSNKQKSTYKKDVVEAGP